MLVSQAVHAAELFIGDKLPADTTERVYLEIIKEKENILLIGMPSSGKSTVGRIIAEKLGRVFVDTDELIEKRAGMQIKDIFATYGEARFREIESLVISQVARECGLVIATGGGAVLKKDNRVALEYNGKMYYIDRSVENLIPTDTRPLASDRAAIESLYNERFDIYCSVCEERIDGDRDPEEVADDIMEKYR